MTKKKIIAIILCIIIISIALFDYSLSIPKKELFSQSFFIDGTYYNDTGNIEIKFEDKTGKTSKVTIEVLGLEKTYHKIFEGSTFSDTIYFGNAPEYGWQVHPIVLVIEHQEFGVVELKTEIYEEYEMPPPVIYNQR